MIGIEIVENRTVLKILLLSREVAKIFYEQLYDIIRCLGKKCHIAAKQAFSSRPEAKDL